MGTAPVSDIPAGFVLSAPTDTLPPPLPATGGALYVNMGRSAQAMPPARWSWETAAPLIERFESGGRNVHQGIVSPSVSTASGFWQITNTNWRNLAPDLGIDLAKYPTAMSAPRELQAKVGRALFEADQARGGTGFGDWAPYNRALAAALKSPSAAEVSVAANAPQPGAVAAAADDIISPAVTSATSAMADLAAPELTLASATTPLPTGARPAVEVPAVAPRASTFSDIPAGFTAIEQPIAAPAAAQPQSELSRLGSAAWRAAKETAAVPAGAVLGLARIPMGIAQFAEHGAAAIGIPGAADLAAAGDTEAKRLEDLIAALPATEGALLTPQNAATVAGMLGLARATSGLPVVASTVPRSLVVGGVAGGVGAGMMPSAGGPDYWQNKLRDVALGAAVGGAIGGGVNMLSRAINPAIPAESTRLLDKDVRLTPGQMLGGGIKSTEEKMTSVPFSGGSVAAAQRRAMEDWNRSVFDDVARFAGSLYQGRELGNEAFKQVERDLSLRYDALKPAIRFQADPQYLREVRQLRSAVAGLPRDLERAVDHAIGRVNTMMGRARAMDGQTFKEVESELSSTLRTWASPTNSALERKVGDAIRDLLGALRSNIERKSAPGVRDALRDLNTAWAGLVRLRDAVSRRPTATGVFTPGDLLGVEKTVAGRAVFARGDGLLQQTATDAQRVLGNRYPDSGTAGRAATLGEIAGFGGLAMTRPDLAAALVGAHLGQAAAYSAPGVNFLRKMAGEGLPRTRNALSGAVRAAGRLAAPYGGYAMGGGP